MNRKRILSLMLTLAMIFTLLPSGTVAYASESEWDVVTELQTDFNATDYPEVGKLPWVFGNGWIGNPAGVNLDLQTVAGWSGERVGRYNATGSPRGGQANFHVPVQSNYRVTMDFDWYAGTPNGTTSSSYGKLAIQDDAKATFSNSGGAQDNQFINFFSSNVSGNSGVYYVIGNVLDTVEYRVGSSAGSTRVMPFTDPMVGTKIGFTNGGTTGDTTPLNAWYNISLDLDYRAKTIALTVKNAAGGTLVDNKVYPFPHQSETDPTDWPWTYSPSDGGTPLIRASGPVKYLNQIASFRFFNASNWQTYIDNIKVQAHIPFVAPVLSNVANQNAAKGTFDLTIAPYSVPESIPVNDMAFNIYAKTNNEEEVLVRTVSEAGTYTINVPRGNNNHTITADAVVDGTITKRSVPLAVNLSGVVTPKPAFIEDVNFTVANGQIGLSWSPVENADEYVIHRAFFATSAFEKVGKVDTPSFTDIHSRLTDTAHTYYKIEAIGDAGTSGLSQEFSSPISGHSLQPRTEAGKDRALTAVNLAGSKGADTLISATGPDGQELTSGVYLSWRWFEADESGNTTFTLYKNGEAIQTSLTVTNLVDPTGNMYDVYRIEGSSDTDQGIVAGDVRVWTDFYQELQLYQPPAQSMMNGSRATYTPNDMTVADLDGDGVLDVIVKWYPSNASDTSIAGQTGTTFFDGYKVNWNSGEVTLLWRVDLGINMRSGAHFAQFCAADFAGLGYAQMMVNCPTSTRSWHSEDGTDQTLVLNDGRVGDGAVAANPPTGTGNAGSTHIAAFDGKTGDIIDSVTRDSSIADKGRDNATIAILKGRARPSFVMTTQYNYGGAVEYYFNDSSNLAVGMKYTGSAWANHNVKAVDLDGDGFDEIILGATVLNSDLTLRYTNGTHGDAMHVSNFIDDPENYPDINGHPRQFIMGVQEYPGSAAGRYSAYTRDASSGDVLVGWNSTPNDDTGRGMAGDVDPTSKNAEMWASNGPRDVAGGNWDTRTGGLYSLENYGIANVLDDTGNLTKLADLSPSMNFTVFWDGDLLTELQDHVFNEMIGYKPVSTNITKWDYINGKEIPLFNSTEVFTVNGTKGNPNLCGDILGDWREELIFRDAKDNSKVRLYMTTIQTDYVIPHLMEDQQYSNMMQAQQSAYNQPPTTSYMPSSRAITPRELDYHTLTATSGLVMSYTPANDGQYGMEITGHQLWRRDGGPGTFNGLTPKGTLSDSTKYQLEAAGYMLIDEVAGDDNLTDATALVGTEYSYIVVGVAGGKLSYMGRPTTIIPEDRSAEVTGVTVTAAKTTLTVIGETAELTADVQPVNAQSRKVTWSSTNENVATVDKNGVVTAVGIGKATIWATAVSGGLRASIVMTVDVSKFTVTFTADGVTYTTRAVPMGTALGSDMPLNPYQSDYVFVGWFDTANATGGTKFTAATVITDNTEVFARFTENTTTAEAGQRWQFNFRQAGSPVIPDDWSDDWIEIGLSGNDTWAANPPFYPNGTADGIRYGVVSTTTPGSRGNQTGANSWYAQNPADISLTDVDRFGNSIQVPRNVVTGWVTNFEFGLEVPNGAYDVIVVLGNSDGGASRGGLIISGEPKDKEVRISSNPSTATTTMVSRAMDVPTGDQNANPRVVILSAANNILVKDGYLGITTGGANFNVQGYIIVVAAIHAELEEAISEAGKLNRTNYSTGSWAALQAAIDAGQAALNKGGSNADTAYSQVEIGEFAKAITDAIGALVPRSPVAGNDANLSALTVTYGSDPTTTVALDSEFSSDKLIYNATVPYNVSSITVTATAAHADATVTGDGLKRLIAGTNTVYIDVTAEDGTTLTYSLIITRMPKKIVLVDNQVGTLTEGTSGSVTFDVKTLNIPNTPDDSYEVIVNGGGSLGIIADEINIFGDAGTLTLNTIKDTPHGSHMLTITIDGAESNKFNLVVSSKEPAVIHRNEPTVEWENDPNPIELDLNTAEVAYIGISLGDSATMLATQTSLSVLPDGVVSVDPEILTADGNITVTGLSVGSAVIYVTFQVTGLSDAYDVAIEVNVIDSSHGQECEVLVLEGTIEGGTDSGFFREGDTVTVIANPPEEGYRFKEWQASGITLTDEEKTQNPLRFDMPANGVILEAVYEQITFTVTYDANNATSGNVPVDSTEYDAGARITVLGNTGGLSRIGYTFAGWSMAANSGILYRAGDTFVIDGGVTLYARWNVSQTVGVPPATDDGSHSSPPSSSTVATSTPKQQKTTAQETEKSINSSLLQSGDVVVDLGKTDSLDINVSTINKLVSNDKPLIVKKDGIAVEIPKESLAAMANGQTASAVVNISITPITNTNKLNEITKVTSNRSESVVSESLLDITITGGSTAKTFQQPIAVTIDLSGKKLTAADIAILSGVRFNADSSVDLLGGTYNEKDKTFTFYTNEAGSYGLIKTKNLVTIELKIGDNTYSVKKDSKSSDVAPVIIGDRTMVPLRVIAEAFGADITWDAATKTATIKLDDKTLKVTIGVQSAGMDVAPMIIEDRTMVPLKFIAEAFSSNVLWDNETKEITIYR